MSALKTDRAGFAARVAHEYHPVPGYLVIGLDGEEVGYLLDRIQDGVKLTKVQTYEEHHVAFGEDGWFSCDCKGFQYRRICRHSVTISRMMESGEV